MKIAIFFLFPLFCFPLQSAEKNIGFYPFPEAESVTTEPFRETLPLIRAASSLKQQLISRSKRLEERLLKKIFGQEDAVRETANAIVRFTAGVSDPSTPIASLLYCGPSGVGKTELAKQLCLELYGSSEHFLRINMSEYGEAHTISRLIGAPPGYVGYDVGGTLSNGLLQTPYSVVLLDEIEKAHPQVLRLFLHVFDAGYFTSARGEDVDCTKAIFILTSNIASREIARLYQRGNTTAEILEILKPHVMDVLSPEMFNRLDCMVFAPLSDEIFELLIRKILGELRNRIWRMKGIEVHFDRTLVNFLKQNNLDPELGARPLKRLVEKELATVLAKAILEQSCKEGDYLVCSYMDGGIVLEVLLSEES